MEGDLHEESQFIIAKVKDFSKSVKVEVLITDYFSFTHE